MADSRHDEIELLLSRSPESLTRVLLDAAPIASSIAIDGRIVYANDACARLWAFDDPARMVGVAFFDLIAPESHDIVIDLWRQRVEGSDPWTYVLTGVRTDGSMFEYRCTSVSLETQRGKATFAYFEDISAEDDGR